MLKLHSPPRNVLFGGTGDLRGRKPLPATCFCPYCQDSAHKRGININRAKEGFLKLLEFSKRSWLHAGEGTQWRCPSIRSPIYPGIGIDGNIHRYCEPEYVRDGLLTVYRAGAKGVVLSRGFGEMRPKTLRRPAKLSAKLPCFSGIGYDIVYVQRKEWWPA